MFRCITKLKGLIIDFDSFNEVISVWEPFIQKYKCLFMTSSSDQAQRIKDSYVDAETYVIEPYLRNFVPSLNTQKECLKKLKLEATEAAFLSSDNEFLRKAMGFLTGTIWITKRVSYSEASHIADIVCKDLPSLYRLLEVNDSGFLGETMLYPNCKDHGIVLPVLFDADHSCYWMLMLGRYFSYSSYMSQLHPYSSAIFYNKLSGSKVYGTFNSSFEKMYQYAAHIIMQKYPINGICSVPSRPGSPSRFQNIVHNIADHYHLSDLNNSFQTIRNYSTQKYLSQQERKLNVQNIFSFNGNLEGKNIILIDDIVTTGETLRSCIRSLKKAGADQIFIIVLAVNQFQESYWSSIPAQVNCPNCGSKMCLNINSWNHSFFYFCKSCQKNLSFEDGRSMIIHTVNHEIINRE